MLTLVTAVVFFLRIVVSEVEACVIVGMVSTMLRLSVVYHTYAPILPRILEQERTTLRREDARNIALAIYNLDVS